jgi:hypothetical protein
MRVDAEALVRDCQLDAQLLRTGYRNGATVYQAIILFVFITKKGAGR